MRKRITMMVAGGVLAAVMSVGALVGVVQARSHDQSPTPQSGQQQARRDEFINRLAQNLGVTPDKLREGLKQTALQEVDQAQADGRITADRAQQLKDRINSGASVPFGPGLGKMHREHGREHMGERADHGMPAGKDQLSQFLGITPQQLKDELRGKSLAQVAEAHGKSRDQLKQFITDTAQQHADQAVQRLKDRLDQIIDRVH